MFKTNQIEMLILIMEEEEDESVVSINFLTPGIEASID
jgi:hypothetical protein